MDDRVILKGLWCCTHAGNCSSCPFDIKGGKIRDDEGSTCLLNLIKAAREALTPRVLALEEIHRGMAVWLEDRDKPDVMLAIGGSSAGGAKCFITEDDRSIAPLDEDYNVRWRAWTREPDEKQRKAAGWHERRTAAAHTPA